jgi:hypothetical protein
MFDILQRIKNVGRSICHADSALQRSKNTIFYGCLVGGVDVGTRAKVKWTYVVFHNKIRKIEKKVF